LQAIADDGGGEEGRRFGSIRWPVPPCEHQTTHDLGEHLRIRARRAGLEAWIGAGEGWTAEGGWTSESGEAPATLLHEGLIEAEVWRAACGRGEAEVPEAGAVVRREADDWPLEVAIYPCAR
jgi:hypothetical protein